MSEEKETFIDKTPICFTCGYPMEWTGEYREIPLDGGMFIVNDPIYECPECDYYEDEEEWFSRD